VRFRLLGDRIYLAPQLPSEWDAAELNLPSVAMTFRRSGNCESLLVCIANPAEKIIILPMRYARIEQLLLNGEEVSYTLQKGFGRSYLECHTTLCGKIELKVFYAEVPFPSLHQAQLTVFSGNLAVLAVQNGSISAIESQAGLLEVQSETPTEHIVRILAHNDGQYDCLVTADNVLLPLTLEVRTLPPEELPLSMDAQEMLPLTPFFNCALQDIHQQEFRSPRPQTYSIGTRLNGRYAWEWNHYGHNALQVDDALLRNSAGVFTTPSGWQFATPAQGKNAACVSLWENFPTLLEMPLTGRARALAVLYCGTTNAMQTAVCNARLEVLYADGSKLSCDLRQPDNFDDFLLPTYQKLNEVVYFGHGTHGLVQIIRLDADRELRSFQAEAIANEVILDVLGLTLAR